MDERHDDAARRRAHRSAGSSCPGRADDPQFVLSADPPRSRRLYASGVVGHALRALWAGPRPPEPAVRVRRDWVLLAVLVSWSVLETIFRDDLVWRPLALAVGAVVALALLWR